MPLFFSISSTSLNCEKKKTNDINWFDFGNGIFCSLQAQIAYFIKIQFQ